VVERVVVVAVVEAEVIVTVTALDVLEVYEELPPYDAVIECVPTARAEVEMLVLPELRVPVPWEVEPS